MENFNLNNPTILDDWSEDEMYDFAKDENKWLKEIRAENPGKKYCTVEKATDPTFSSVEEINEAFLEDIEERKNNFKNLCHICDYATNNTATDLKKHLHIHGIGVRFKCEKCEKHFHKNKTLQDMRNFIIKIQPSLVWNVTKRLNRRKI